MILPIELKAVQASLENITQIQRYVDWLEQYYIPNRTSIIQPVLLTKKFRNKNSEIYDDLLERFRYFNIENPTYFPLKYIEYELNSENNLVFYEVNY